MFDEVGELIVLAAVRTSVGVFQTVLIRLAFAALGLPHSHCLAHPIGTVVDGAGVRVHIAANRQKIGVDRRIFALARDTGVVRAQVAVIAVSVVALALIAA